MAATQLHVGDLVRLKTGSPIVKIHRIHQGTALCRWCNGTKKDWGIFELESLVPASNKGDSRQRPQRH